MPDTEQLSETLRRSVVQPEDSGYDKARAIWNGKVNRRPEAIIRCKGAVDVISVVNFARDEDLTLSIHGGGHRAAGHAVCDGGLMIDFSLMNSVRVNPKAETVRVGPGATGRDMDYETQASGLGTTGAPV